jgi:dihydroorotase
MENAATFHGIWRNEAVRLPDGPTDCDIGTTAGRPVGTILRGATVMWENELAPAPTGVPLLLDETLRNPEARTLGRVTR